MRAAARAAKRRAQREWIVRAGSAPATTPMWTSRAGWLAELAAWLDIEEGRAACARKVRPEMFLRVAEVLAASADHSTGRHCAVTNAVVAEAAGCSARTVSTVRRLLRDDAKLAVEVHRGTGCAAAPRSVRRPSVWHLVSRREPVDNPAVFHLPPTRRVRRFSHLGKKSPSDRTRPPRKSNPSKTTARRSAPRPLRTQKLAAGLVARSIGLDTVHVGQICDVLSGSGLDLDAWTSRQINDALNAHMSTTGLSWPDRIENPAGFLAARLRRLPVRPDGAPRGGVTAASMDHSTALNVAIPVPLSPPQVLTPETISTPANPSHRAAMLAEIRATIARPKARQ